MKFLLGVFMRFVFCLGAFLLSCSSLANDCYKDLLGYLDVDQNVETSIELRKELAKTFNDGADQELFELFIEDANPFFKYDYPLSEQQVIWVRDFMDSDILKNFKVASERVKVISGEDLPDVRAKYLISKEMSKVDYKVFSSVYLSKVDFIATTGSVTTVWTDMKGVPAPGHGGKLYDDIKAAFGLYEGKHQVVIAMVKDDTGSWILPSAHHGSSNIVLHEYGHALDYYLGMMFDHKKMSQDPAFHKAWYSEWENGGFKENYYIQPEDNYANGLSEAFAEGYAKYFSRDGVSHTDWPYLSNYFSIHYLIKSVNAVK